MHENPLKKLYERQDEILVLLHKQYRGADLADILAEYVKIRHKIRTLEGMSISAKRTYTLNDEKPIKRKKVKK